MKFYYDGQLIRTSKTHHYTHACVAQGSDGKWCCISCSSSKAGAEKVKADKIREHERLIDSCNRAIKAHEDGKDGYYSRHHEWISFKHYDLFATKEIAEQYKAEEQRRLNLIKANWIIVEVEEA